MDIRTQFSHTIFILCRTIYRSVKCENNKENILQYLNVPGAVTFIPHFYCIQCEMHNERSFNCIMYTVVKICIETMNKRAPFCHPDVYISSWSTYPLQTCMTTHLYNITSNYGHQFSNYCSEFTVPMASLFPIINIEVVDSPVDILDLLRKWLAIQSRLSVGHHLT